MTWTGVVPLDSVSKIHFRSLELACKRESVDPPDGESVRQTENENLSRTGVIWRTFTQAVVVYHMF